MINYHKYYIKIIIIITINDNKYNYLTEYVSRFKNIYIYFLTIVVIGGGSGGGDWGCWG